MPSTTAALVTDGDAHPWDGISEVILGKKEWVEAWVEGERKYFETISSRDALLFADEDGEDETDTRPADRELRPRTNSARRVKTLV